jgi:hypothetical protein
VNLAGHELVAQLGEGGVGVVADAKADDWMPAAF